MAKQFKKMSGYDCRNKWVFSFWRNAVSDGADWTSTGRLFQSRGPAAANERSLIVTSRDGWMSRRLEVDKHSRPWRLDSKSAMYWSWPDRDWGADSYWGAVPWRARYTRTTSLNLMRSGAWSQCKLARASVICSERRRPAIDRAAALMTDWRRLSRLVGKPANVALP